MSEELKPCPFCFKKDKQIAELEKELSNNADEGYVGFMLGVQQMKKKLDEKDKEIERLKDKLSIVKNTLTEYRDAALTEFNARKAEHTHYIVFWFCNTLLEKMNAPDNNVGSMEEEK